MYFMYAGNRGDIVQPAIPIYPSLLVDFVPSGTGSTRTIPILGNHSQAGRKYNHHDDTFKDFERFGFGLVEVRLTLFVENPSADMIQASSHLPCRNHRSLHLLSLYCLHAIHTPSQRHTQNAVSRTQLRKAQRLEHSTSG
jgi:hypothetical protein